MTRIFTYSGYGICGRKKQYVTKSAALNIAKKMKKKTGIQFYYYECPLCGLYHLSKKDHMIKTYAIKTEGIYFNR